MEQPIASKRPLEAAQVFLKPRLRLCHRVPVAETLSFVYMFKGCIGYYEDIRLFVEKMIEGVRRFFAQDMYVLSLLEA